MWRAVLLFLVVVPAAAQNIDERFRRWAAIKDPAPGPPRVIGAYSAGCLAGAEKIPLDGDGYSLMRPSRRRYFGHPDLARYLRDLAAALKSKGQGVLLVGDASPPRGGPMASGHNSHQSGLDVDLWLRMLSKRPSRQDRERLSATSYVQGRKTLRKNWGRTQTNLVATAASFEAVNRVFVAPAIKRYFCETEPGAPWLYKLRAWWGHEEHIHVRLNCPAESTGCQPQDPLDASQSGCGEELAWWFSKEADEEWLKLKAKTDPREFPELPEECGEIGPDVP